MLILDATRPVPPPPMTDPVALQEWFERTAAMIWLRDVEPAGNA